MKICKSKYFKFISLIVVMLIIVGLTPVFATSDENVYQNINNDNNEESAVAIDTESSSALIENGTYIIQNMGTKRFIDIEGPSISEGSNIQEWDFHNGNQMKWNITRQSDGFYTIQSVLSNKYIGVENNSSSNNAAIKQYTSNTSDGTRWNISVSNSGNYIFTAKSANAIGVSLSVPLNSNFNGTNLTQYTYSNDNSFNDEWAMYPTSQYRGQVTWWNADINEVAYWSSTPTLYKDVRADNTSFYFNAGYIIAKSQWGEALDTTYTEVAYSDANIVCYGLTAEQYEEITGIAWQEGSTGLTGGYVFVTEYYVMYGNEVIKVKRKASSVVYILMDVNNLRSINSYRKTISHELGHALGYYGHSENETDVMYKFAHEDYLLKDGEIDHLKQIYDIMN